MHSFLKQAGPPDAPVLLKSVCIAGALRGMLLDVVLEQCFGNPSEHHIEAIYTFPLPSGAVLLDVSVRLGEKKLAARIAAKQAAEAAYEDAIAEGDAGVMVEVNPDGSYTLNLGNLASREECTVSLHYVRKLAFEHGGLRIQVPAVIAPRFGSPLLDAGLQPHQVSGHDPAAHYPLSLTLQIPGHLSSALSSPSHAITIAHEGTDTVVSLAQAAVMDRDFILVMQNLDTASMARAEPDSVLPGHFAAMASFMPRMPEPGNAALAFKLLVDCSGSMAGDSINAARLAVDAIVGRLKPQDRFSLSRFGDTVEHASARMRKASPSAVRMARQWAKSLEADLGGTEMADALASTIHLACEGPADILLFTDGAIHAIDAVVERARASKQRVFVVGIGSSPAEAHLRLLAEASGGACDFLAPGEAAGPAILRMFARLSTPSWRQVEVAWPAPPLWQSASQNLFEGDTHYAYALFREPPAGEVALYASDGSAARTLLASAELVLADQESGILAKFAALARFGALSERVERQQLALDYHLLTEFTSFILVHERTEGDKANDMPALHVVPQMMAAGASGFGTVGGGRRGYHVQSAVQAYGAAPSFLRVSRGPAVLQAPAVWRRGASLPGAAPAESGLTPLAFAERLSSGHLNTMEMTFAGLEEAGIGRTIVAWLEREFGQLDENLVVSTFLFVIGAEPLAGQLFGGNGLRNLLGKVKGIVAARPATRPMVPWSVDDTLARKLQAALSDITAQSWGRVGNPKDEPVALDIPQFLRKQAD